MDQVSKPIERALKCASDLIEASREASRSSSEACGGASLQRLSKDCEGSLKVVISAVRKAGAKVNQAAKDADKAGAAISFLVPKMQRSVVEKVQHLLQAARIEAAEALSATSSQTRRWARQRENQTAHDL